MAEWICPVCNFKADGDEAEVEAQRSQHMEETAEDMAHQEMIDQSEVVPAAV